MAVAERLNHVTRPIRAGLGPGPSARRAEVGARRRPARRRCGGAGGGVDTHCGTRRGKVTTGIPARVRHRESVLRGQQVR